MWWSVVICILPYIFNVTKFASMPRMGPMYCVEKVTALKTTEAHTPQASPQARAIHHRLLPSHQAAHRRSPVFPGGWGHNPM
jgi:hypothetical protein